MSSIPKFLQNQYQCYCRFRWNMESAIPCPGISWCNGIAGVRILKCKSSLPMLFQYYKIPRQGWKLHNFILYKNLYWYWLNEQDAAAVTMQVYKYLPTFPCIQLICRYTAGSEYINNLCAVYVYVIYINSIYHSLFFAQMTYYSL